MNALERDFAFVPQRYIGAARLPALLFVWTLGLLFLQEIRAYAAPVFAADDVPRAIWWMPPAPPPVVESAALWNAVAARSDVVRGEWQPETKRERAARPVEASSARDPSSRPPMPAMTMRSAIREQSSLPQETRPLVPAMAPRSAIRERSSLLPEKRAESPKQAARVAVAAGDDEAAYRLLTETLPDIRTDREHYDLLAAVLMRTGRYDDAADVYGALLALDGGDPRLWAGYAMAQEQLGRREAGTFGYRKLLQTAAADSPLHRLALERLGGLG